MATNYKVNKGGKLNFWLSIILTVFVMNFSFSQEHVHTASCVSSHEVSCTKDVKVAFDKLERNTSFKKDFTRHFQIDFSEFMQLNSYEKEKFINYLVNEVCFKNRSTNELGTIFIELIEKTKDNYWFEKPVVTSNSEMDQVSKGVFIPKKEPNTDNTPKTAACLNADFETGDYTGWTAFCGTVTGATMGGTTSEGTACGGQHAIVSGGTDAYTGSSRVFQGGNSAMLGDGTGTGSRYARLRKTFVVAASNPAITYSYMAVLQDPGTGHTNPQRPFFSARVFVGGSEISCAQYFSYFGDGAPGWVTGGGVAYRDWTSVFVPLESYIGQTITLEITVGDCSQSGHWGYAYVDVSCENMEVEQFCEGSSTVLSAPSEGIQAYQWSTGETTQQIVVTTPGVYTVNILPIGSICSATLTYNASIYPVPTADFSVDNTSICIGGNVNFTNNSTVETGGTITSYQWNYGDGISTPASTGTITGVPQTTGTYTANNHTYNSLGTFNATLTMQTSDGCTNTSQVPITVIQGPEATIGGNTVVCSGTTPPEVTFTGSQTPPPFTFTYNINGGPAQTVTTSSGNSVTVPVPTTTPGSYTYNLTHVSSSSSAMCEQDQTGAVTIVVNPIPNATIATDAIVCQGAAAPVITFTGSNGTSDYQFTYSLNGGASQTISTSGTNTATITVATTTPGTFQYTLLSVEDVTTGCSQTFTGPGHTSTVVVNPLPDAGITGTTVVCQNDAQPVITFTGTGSSGNYTFSYAINGGSSQTITTTGGSNQATVNAPTNVPGTYVYELLNVADPATGCNQNINETQTITVNPLPAATIYGSTTVCQNDAQPQITFTGDYGTSDYEFTYTINGGVHETIMTSGSPSVTVNVPTSVGGTYVYELISVMDVTTGCFQTQSGTATVVVNLMPTATIGGTVTVCQDAAAPVITFTGQNSSGEYTYSYTINGGPTQTITTSGSNSATVTQSTAVPGTYVYTLTNVMDPASLCNQDLNLTETITVNPLPVASISNPVQACHMDAVLPEVVFTGSVGTAPYTFAYNINGGATQYATSTGSTVTFPVSTGTTGTFIYTITNIQEGSALGCQQTQNVSTIVTIHALPNVSAGNDFPVCAGVPIVLTGSGAQTYQWDNGVTNGVPFTPTDTTTYTVIGTDHNGCRNTDQITVNVVPIPVMDIDGINLYGCSPVIPTFTNNSTGNLTNCTWYLGNGEVLQGCGSVSSVFDVPGCFDVTLVVSTPEGCTNSLTINNYVCVEANPIADFYPKPAELTTYDWETQMINESSGATSYYWDFGDGTAPGYEHSPYHEYPNDFAGVYQVMLVASTPAGCVDTAYATVTLKEELLFYVPNTFTPDGDDYNETFKPIFTTGFDPYNYTLLIFNRWGEVIFESHDTNVGWNGKYGIDGKLCQDGTYTWKIDVKGRTSSQQSQFTGHVNLIR
ncbi:gliding motility-associated C-terminal domain-containing protein [Crocinitomicaceae bacterium CZZ-1]|uniref:Gliding motility-associated C-terminal domain-containing protein n=1 Tax=Taishania pollutisoli TaxID=2766479 RepID=A0A8J6PE88_9FLAO|nr:PKD domain-containing protein [Taishania pollutisoli]MBC9812260.1 gliding motility-associated C-terminal domain-containing protein [Taishania pollutisoli]